MATSVTFTKLSLVATSWLRQGNQDRRKSLIAICLMDKELCIDWVRVYGSETRVIFVSFAEAPRFTQQDRFSFYLKAMSLSYMMHLIQLFAYNKLNSLIRLQRLQSAK